MTERKSLGLLDRGRMTPWEQARKIDELQKKNDELLRIIADLQKLSPEDIKTSAASERLQKCESNHEHCKRTNERLMAENQTLAKKLEKYAHLERELARSDRQFNMRRARGSFMPDAANIAPFQAGSKGPLQIQTSTEFLRGDE